MQGVLAYFISPEGLRVDLRMSFLLYLMYVVRWFGFTRLGYGILFGLSDISRRITCWSWEILPLSHRTLCWS